MDSGSKPRQDPNLDILRSVAVLTVFVTHALQVIAGCRYGEHMAYGIETFSLGRVGVLLFFVHTSLVLMQSLERANDGRSNWSLMKNFYIRRAFRIYPLSVSLIVVSIAFSIPPHALNAPYRWEGWRWAVANVLLIQNVAGVSAVASPLWSLPYEIQMYLALPIIFLSLRRPRFWGRLACIYVTGAVLSQLHPVFEFFPCFLAGVVAYQLLASVRPRLPSWLWTPSIVGLVVLYTLGEENHGKEILACLIAGTMIPLFQRSFGAISVAASQIAKYSYGIYLCHTPVLWLLYRKLTIPSWEKPILLVIATAVASVACYYAIEQPLLRFGTRIATRQETGATKASLAWPRLLAGRTTAGL